MVKQLRLALMFVCLYPLCGITANAQTKGETFTCNDKKYKVTGDNLITNGSFEDGFTGWTSANDFTTELSSSKFTLISDGAQDGTKYLKGTTNEASKAAGSIGTAWDIETGKTYVFSYYCKSLKGGTETGYLKTALTNTKGTETSVLGTPTVTGDGAWCLCQTVFTNTDSYKYLQVQFRWLDSQWGFDNFVIAEVVEMPNPEALEAGIAEAEAYYNEDLVAATELLAAINTAKSYLSSESIDEINKAVEDLKKALADAKTEETPFKVGGNYYLKNVENGKYLGAGNSYGTQASLVEHGDYVTLQLSDDYTTYTLESRVSNGGTSYYFNGSYMDNGTPVHLTFTHVGEYYTMHNGDTYYGYDGASTVLANNLAVDATGAKWQVISEADMKASLTTATAEAPVDATFLIKDHNFSRNHRDKSAWIVSEDCTNKNLAGGDNTNMCAESYHSVFNIGQTLSVPNGVYTLVAQGFYRQDGTDNKNLPMFYANDATSTFPLLTGGENSMANASVSFSKGAYTIVPIFVQVTDGTLNVGVKLENNAKLWCIWDHFVLTYYGETTIAAVQNLELAKAHSQALADAQTALADPAYSAADASKQENIDLKTLTEAATPNSTEEYEDAIEALTTATRVFKEAATAYSAALEYVATVTTNYATLLYATQEKKDALKETLDAYNPTTVAEIEIAKTEIQTSYRKVIESNAMAEAVEGAKDMTSLIVNALGDNLAGWNNPVLATASNQPWTSADGNTSHSYFDTQDAWGKNSWSYDMNQIIVLPAGKYLLSVMARSAADLTQFQLYAGETTKDMPKSGNAGHTFNNGWEMSTIEFNLAEFGGVQIGVKLATETIHTWASFGNFQLVQLEGEAFPTGEITNDYITNPSFETGDKTGWTFGEGTDTSVRTVAGTGADGSYMFSTWNWDGSIEGAYDINQTVGLPAGEYVLVASAAYHTHDDLTLYANDATTNLARLATDSEFNTTALAFSLVEPTNVKFGLKSKEGATGNAGWFKCDNFHLYRYVTEEEANAKRLELLPTVVLDQAEPLVISQDAKSVTLNRPLVEGWNSLVVPFNMSEEELAIHKLTAYEYAGTEVVDGKLNANFNVATSIEANKPYIVKATAAKENIRLEGNIAIVASTELTTEDANGVFDFVGLYTKQETSPIAAGDYIVLSEGIKKTAGKNPIKAFRAYLKNVEPTETRALLFNVEGEGTLTGLDAVEFERAFLGDEAYDLSGRRVNKNAKGIVISNGKKVVIK